MSAALAPRSSVRRRILGLFVLCGLLPVTAAILVSYDRVAKELVAQRAALLRGAASNFASVLVDRLGVAEQLAHGAAAGGTAALAASENALRQYFRAAAIIDRDGSRVQFGNPRQAPSAAQINGVERPLVPGAAKLLVLRDAKARAAVWIAVSSGTGDGSRKIAFELDPDFLWAAQDALPYLSEACVLDAAGRPLDCSRPPAPLALEHFRATLAGARGDGFSWAAGDSEYLSGLRELFLKGRFGSGSWLVIATQHRDYALAPVRALAAVVIPVVLLALLLTALLGLVHVRRTLQPLNALAQAAERVATRDFDVRVAEGRNDEFGMLAQSFNAMSGRLGRQFKALQAQAEIDAVILSSADLERVVAIALHRISELAHAEQYYLLLADPGAEAQFRLYSAEGDQRVGHAARRSVARGLRPVARGDARAAGGARRSAADVGAGRDPGRDAVRARVLARRRPCGRVHPRLRRR